jgi:hypothetical protein
MKSGSLNLLEPSGPVKECNGVALPLRMKGFYMFRALLAHLQEALHKRHSVYCVCVMSIGSTRIGMELVQPTDISRTQYIIPSAVISASPEDE